MAAAAENASTLYAGELEIRLGEGLVLATGRALTLSVREFELLAAMARRAGAIVTRSDLYAEVWGGELRAGDRSVDVYVSKLRGKLEAAMPDRRYIHTHPGFGYRFQPQPAVESAPDEGPVRRTTDEEHARSAFDEGLSRIAPHEKELSHMTPHDEKLSRIAPDEEGLSPIAPHEEEGLSRNVHNGALADSRD